MNRPYAVLGFTLLFVIVMMTSCQPSRKVRKQRDITLSVIDPLPTIEQQVKALKRVKPRNKRVVTLDQNGSLTFGGRETTRTKIAEQIHQFIINADSSPDLAAKPIKAVIAFRSHKDVQYEEYNRVETALKRGFYKARDTYAKREYGKSYYKLSYKTRKKIRKVIPRNLIEAEPYVF